MRWLEFGSWEGVWGCILLYGVLAATNAKDATLPDQTD
jgi:hypothetical protein